MEVMKNLLLEFKVETVVSIFKKKFSLYECNEFKLNKLPFISEYCNFIVFSFQSNK